MALIHSETLFRSRLPLRFLLSTDLPATVSPIRCNTCHPNKTTSIHVTRFVSSIICPPLCLNLYRQPPLYIFFLLLCFGSQSHPVYPRPAWPPSQNTVSLLAISVAQYLCLFKGFGTWEDQNNVCIRLLYYPEGPSGRSSSQLRA